MESAKETVKNFMKKSGEHDTKAAQTMNAPVQHETVHKTHHEDLQPAVDREVHQDHYHTSVQPVKQSETLTEQHHHRAMPVEERHFEHDNKDEVARHLAAQQAQFQHQHARVEGEHTASTGQTITGERVHHHVHEQIQPVIHKQTVEPHVTHTTMPVHEVHHNAAKHYETSTLPAMTMDEFNENGSLSTNGKAKLESYAGTPKMIDSLQKGV